REVVLEAAPRLLDGGPRPQSPAARHYVLEERRPARRRALGEQPDQVLQRFAAAEYLLAPRLGDLVARQLHHRTARVLDQLVRRVEVRVVRRDAHPRAHAEGVDLRAGLHELVDLELVEAAADDDPHRGQAGGVELGARELREADQVAAVDAHADATLQV